MAVSLVKGQKVDLTKGKPEFSKLVVGLGWDVNKYDDGAQFDLDTEAFLLADDEKVLQDGDFIFYGNLKHSSGAVEHLGDNLTGIGDGDDEQIKVELSKVPDNISKIVFAATIHEAEERKQNFGQVNNAYIRVLDESNGEELLRYDLCEDYSIETAVIIAEIYRHNGEWKFNAVGRGVQGGLYAVCKGFGVNV